MAPVLDPRSWRDLPEVRFDAGDPVFTAGERSTAMLVLLEGRVRVEAGGATIAVLDEPGTVVGEMAGLLGVPRGAAVVAATDIVARRVDDVVTFCRTDPDAAVAIAQMLAYRLHLVNSYLADVRRQYGDRSDHLGMLDTVLGSLTGSLPVDIEGGSDRAPEQ